MRPIVRDLGLATAAGVAFGLPAALLSLGIERGMLRWSQLASLLQLGTGDRPDLWWMPVSLVLDALARPVLLALLVHAVLVALSGRRKWSSTLRAMLRAARALALWVPLALLILGGAFALHGGSGRPSAAFGYGLGLAWLGGQVAVWLLVLGRLPRGLAAAHGLTPGEARFAGWAPLWALLAAGALQAALP